MTVQIKLNYMEEYSSAVVGYDDFHDVRLVFGPSFKKKKTEYKALPHHH